MKKIAFFIFLFCSVAAFSQITVNTNFSVNGNLPIDARDTLTTLADTVNVTWTYPGLLSYAVDVDQFWYYTGSFWKQLETGSILNNYPGSTTKFASDTSVAPDTTGAPSTNEIEVWNYTTQDTNWLNSVIFYTGTDDSTDVITYVYFIDSDGNATLLESPTDPVNFTRRLIPSPAFANANQPLDSEALTFINNLSPPAKPLTVFIQADGAVPGAGTSDNPETAWLYDGVNVTRVKDFPRKFEVPGSAFADSTNATGTEVLTWLLSNPQGGNYLLAYHVGSGTEDKPDFAWWIAGDTNVGYSDIVTIKEPSVSTGTTTTASNGLTHIGSNIKLGGSLAENTTITGAGYDLLTSGLDSFYLDMDGVRLDLDGEKLLHFPGVPGANPINSNLFFGPRAGSAAINTNTGYANTGIGAGALSGLTLNDTGGGTTLSRSNTGIGYNAGAAITTGTYNTLVGTSAGSNAPTTSFQNSGFGQHALISATGNENAAFGANAGGFVAAGNAIFGASAVLSGTGSNNSYFGYKSGENATSGSRNAAFGYLALRSTETSDQVAIGANALRTATTATENTVIGAYAGETTTTSVRNVFIGYEAGRNQLTGGNNIGIGATNLKDCGACLQNVAVGNFVLPVNTGALNTAIGYTSMNDNTSGTRNVAAGAISLAKNTTGSDNLAFGYEAGAENTIGIRNFYGGTNAGKNSVDGNRNTGIGYAALGSIRTSDNVGIGSESGGAATTAIGITAIGASAGRYANRNYNISVGFEANSNIADSTISNVVVIGKGARPTSNNQITLGDSIGGYTQLRARNFRFNIDATPATGNILAWDGTEFSPANTSTGLDANYFKQGGNSFGASATLGTNDANSLNFETNNVTRLTFDTSGNMSSGVLSDITLSGTNQTYVGLNRVGFSALDSLIMFGANYASLGGSASKWTLESGFTRLRFGGTTKDSLVAFQFNNANGAAVFTLPDSNASSVYFGIRGGDNLLKYNSITDQLDLGADATVDSKILLRSRIIQVDTLPTDTIPTKILGVTESGTFGVYKQKVPMTFMHTVSLTDTVAWVSVSGGGIGIPEEYDGWNIIEVVYRTSSTVSTDDLDIQLIRQNTAGSTVGTLAGTIPIGSRYDSVTGSFAVAAGDLIQTQITAGTPAATGLTVTIVLQEN